MNQVKIGKFIAECRKGRNLTQIQLSEKLGITDKAVSKWERGIAMPDSSIMLELCEILGISVNELLSGEKIIMENENKKNEELFLQMAKELEQKDKAIWRTMWVILAVCMTAIVAGAVIAAFVITEEVWQIVTMAAVCVVFLPPCFYALKLEISVGAYKCKHCGNEFVPTYLEALNAMHIGTTRYLKCPNCRQRSWCKKVLKKQQSD